MSLQSPKLIPNGTSDSAANAHGAPVFSWLEPHPIFVIILVGPEEKPFGIQKDFLCSRSLYYQRHFEQTNQSDTLEHVIKLPEVSPGVFGLAQNFLYTGLVSPNGGTVPAYDVLIGVWKLGHQLGIDGLCDKTLEAMGECRRVTGEIPSTPLLVQVWNDTPEGSSIRKLLLSWTAEYMRSSDKKEGFAKSLPHTVLSELVIVMSTFDTVPVVQVSQPTIATATQPTPTRKSVHYLEDNSEEEHERNAKRNRRSSGVTNGQTPQSDRKAATARKPAPRPSLPKPAQKRRSSAAYLNDAEFSAEKKLDFCADLLTRMLSGPGFWTRLVGPFKQAVDPQEDGVPDYFEKVTRPMDLDTIKEKMDRRDYADAEEFLADIRQIFENCYAYWTKGDPMWVACEKFQKTFEEKYAGMNKFLSKLVSEPAD